MTPTQEKLIENYVRRTVKRFLIEEANKTFTIIKTRNGNEKEITGDHDYFIDYFSYTLLKGNSWSKSVIKDPIKLKKLTPEKFVDNLNRAKDAATGNGYDASTDYDLKR